MRPKLNEAKSKRGSAVCSWCQLPREMPKQSRGAGVCLCWDTPVEMSRWVNYLREALGLESMHRVDHR